MNDDIQSQVQSILEQTAPIAAQTLKSAVTSGRNLKKDKAYEAALEVLDRVGFSKQNQTTVHHEGLPSLPPSIIAGALTVLSKMFDKESSLKDITSSWGGKPPEEEPNASFALTTPFIEDDNFLPEGESSYQDGEDAEKEPSSYSPSSSTEEEVTFEISDEVL